MFTLTTTDRYQSTIALDTGNGKRWKALAESQAVFQPCTKCNTYLGTRTTKTVELFSFSTYCADMLDHANADELDNLAEQWAPWTRIHRDRFSVSMCIDVPGIPGDILRDIIWTREKFDAYPALDEDAYNRRVYAAEVETMNAAIHNYQHKHRIAMSEEWQARALQHALDVGAFDDEPGWADPDHLANIIAETEKVA